MAIVSKDNYIKEVFSQALEELMREKKLDNITTSDIIRRSGLSRSTFYRHFVDKYDLAIWRFKSFLAILSRDHSSEETSAQNLHALIQKIDIERDYYKSLLEYQGQNSFAEYYLEITLEWAQEIKNKKGVQLSQKDYYILRYHAAGIMDILSEWLGSDDPLSADDFAELIISNRSELLKDLYID